MTALKREIAGIVNSILYDAENDITVHVFSVIEETIEEHKEAVAKLIKILEVFHEDAHGADHSLMMCQNHPCAEAYNTIRQYTGK